MYPSQVKDVKLLTSASFQWEDTWNALLKEMKDPSVQELWKMAAFLELCPNDIKDQVFLQIDEINENYAVFREKVLAWTTNKVEQEKSSGRAPMDIGEVDDSQSALQSHLDWPGQWQVDEWDMYRAVPRLRIPRNVPLLRRGGAQACRVLEVWKDHQNQIRAVDEQEEEAIEQVECQTCWMVGQVDEVIHPPEASWSRPRKVARRSNPARLLKYGPP